ncbi:MAG: thioredoxin-disulfide reductase, partial [Deltaproteobacteria bacterium]
LLGELVQVDKNGTANLRPQSQMTSVEGVFCCGEAATGVRDVVHSLASGMRAAREVDGWLRKRR